MGCLSDGEPLESPLVHREELFEFDGLLAQLGWGSARWSGGGKPPATHSYELHNLIGQHTNR